MDREVYPNAPLRLVTAEFRFPIASKLAGDGLLALLGERFGDRFPVIQPASVEVVMGPGGPITPGQQVNYVMLTRERTTAVTVGATRLAMETTEYGHWKDFRDGVVGPALAVIGDELEAVAGLDRVGLRFINEIRVPGAGPDVGSWAGYVVDQLLAPGELAGESEIRTVQLALQMIHGDGAELLLRGGILEGRVVDERGPLRLPKESPHDHFFLLDMDSFWKHDGTYDPWSTEAALDIADRLHAPIDDLFERCITDRLREEVLRRVA